MWISKVLTDATVDHPIASMTTNCNGMAESWQIHLLSAEYPLEFGLGELFAELCSILCGLIFKAIVSGRETTSSRVRNFARSDIGMRRGGFRGRKIQVHEGGATRSAFGRSSTASKIFLITHLHIH